MTILAIAARPYKLLYWLMPAPDIARLIEEDEIAFQHADESRWFRAKLLEHDTFSRYRSDRAGLLQKLASLG